MSPANNAGGLHGVGGGGEKKIEEEKKTVQIIFHISKITQF